VKDSDLLILPTDGNYKKTLHFQDVNQKIVNFSSLKSHVT